jgi:CBS domain-containing protein
MIRRLLALTRGNAAFLELAMSEQRPPKDRGGANSAGHTPDQLIEKGWTVYDAVERPVGNVTEVDRSRDVLEVDGRPQGFGTFEVPLGIVESTGANKVHLNQAVDATATGSGKPPRFTAPPTTATTSGTTRSRSRSRTEPAVSASDSTTPSRMAGTSTAPVGTGTMHEFTPPYATRQSGAEPEHAPASWTWGEEGGWSPKKIAMAGLALGGLAATTYFIRRRMRRKSPFERFVDTSSQYFDVASKAANQYFDVASKAARKRHPAWWASLAAAALPIAYYAWPGRKPTHTERARHQADDLASYFAGISDAFQRVPAKSALTPDRLRSYVPRQLPLMSDFEKPSRWHLPGPAFWRSNGRSSIGDWSSGPNVAGTIGALTAGAAAVYLIRRATSKSRTGARIADVMTRQPRVIQPDATVADAAAMMRQLDVGSLPVCDGTRLIGMLTDRDITTRATADGRDPHLTRVRDVMSSGVAWANEDDPVEEAARIMREHRIRRLPIVDDRHSLVGVVSLGDLAVDVRDDDLSGETLERVSEKSRPARDW